MGKYLKLFDNHNGYTAYTADTENFILPNVSCCIQENEVHFNPYVEPSIVAKYNVTSTAYTTRVARTITADTKEMWVDGVKNDTVSYSHQFDTTGEHEVIFVLKDGVTSVSDKAFSGCSNLISIEIPNGITGIGNSVFYTCNSLTSVTIPSSVISIGGSVFAQCSSLTSITIPSGVTSIGNYAFQTCTNLKRINSDVDGVFNIPDSVTSIGNGAFHYCSGLTSIAIPNGVTTLGTQLFGSCGNLSSVTISSSVTSIGQSAFNYCRKLSSVTIPSSVTSIGMDAFDDCERLSSVTCNPVSPPTLGNTPFSSTILRDIYVPSGSVNAYKSDTSWSSYASLIKAIQ